MPKQVLTIVFKELNTSFCLGLLSLSEFVTGFGIAEISLCVVAKVEQVLSMMSPCKMLLLFRQRLKRL